MNENFKKFVKSENKLAERIKKEKIEESRKKLLEEIEKNRILRIKEKRSDLKEGILEKYPDEIKIQKYIDYLNKEAETMEGCKVRKLKIVGESNRESSGHVAERDFLNDVFIPPNERILVLKDKSLESKKKVFSDFVEFYSDNLFQKKEVCKLGEFTESFLKKQIEDSEVEIKEIKFLSGVGTPLDFNFGVDGWVKIIDKENNVVEIYYDMKTGKIGNKSEFADLLLEVEEKNGEIKLDSKVNVEKLQNFLIRVKNIYFAKRSLMLKDSNKIITPKIVKE